MNVIKDRKNKPLGKKSYGSIAHLPNSRMGPGDHKCHEGQARIATEKVRDKHDRIVCQEKLDGTNVGVVLLNGEILPLTRAGYLASSSSYEQHWRFANWVYENQQRFLELLTEGERVCGEWLLQAYGTRYKLHHEPFVVFDIMKDNDRLVLDELTQRIKPLDFVLPKLLHQGSAFSLEAALKAVEVSGHGAIDTVEGAVWRVERNDLIDPRKGGDRYWVVDFLVMYVRPEKQDGIYLPGINGNTEILWNEVMS